VCSVSQESEIYRDAEGEGERGLQQPTFGG